MAISDYAITPPFCTCHVVASDKKKRSESPSVWRRSRRRRRRSLLCSRGQWFACIRRLLCMPNGWSSPALVGVFRKRMAPRFYEQNKFPKPQRSISPNMFMPCYTGGTACGMSKGNGEREWRAERQIMNRVLGRSMDPACLKGRDVRLLPRI